MYIIKHFFLNAQRHEIYDKKKDVQQYAIFAKKH